METDAALADLCNKVRAERGMPDEVLFRLLGVMERTCRRVRELPPGPYRDQLVRWMTEPPEWMSTLPTSVECPVCGKTAAVTKAGRVHAHGYRFLTTEGDCPGSRRRVRPLEAS